MAGHPSNERWMAVGHSRHPDASSAGREAARNAFSGRPLPKLAIVFASDGYDGRQLLAGIRSEIAAEAPLIGCSTAGEIATGGPGEAGVVVTAIGGEGFEVELVAD